MDRQVINGQMKMRNGLIDEAIKMIKYLPILRALVKSNKVVGASTK